MGKESSLVTYHFDIGGMNWTHNLEAGITGMIVYFETDSEHTVPIEVQLTFVSKNVFNSIFYGWTILVLL